MVKTFCGLAIFMICAQTIVHFRPNRSYEKYLRLLAGMLVLVQIFLRGLLFFDSNGQAGFEERVKNFSGVLEDPGQQEGILEEVDRIRTKLYEEICEEAEEGEIETGEKKEAAENKKIQDVEINVRIETKGGEK